MWTQEQKNLSWEKNLERKLGQASDLVMNFCARTCCIANAIMLLDQPRKFVECNVDPQVLSVAEAELFLTCSFPVENLKSNISKSSKFEAAAKTFTDEMEGFSTGKKANVWKITP